MSEHYATLKQANLVFQIEVDPDLAMELREGKDIDIADILKAQNIFSDARKGNLAKTEDIKSVFGTDDVYKVARQIIQKGDVQESASYRNKIRERKRKEIIELVHRNAVDPTTKLPHPITRIENAIEESKFVIDDNKAAKDQLDDVLKAIRAIIPIRFELKKLKIMIPSKHAGKSYGIVRDMGRLLDEQWNNDGSVSITIEIPAGIELEIYDKINSLTHGQAEINER